MIIKLLRFIPYSILIRLYYWYYNDKLADSLQEAARKLKIPIATGKDFSKYKKSNTLFILGSGASINQFTKDDWTVIEKNDSFGFNFSFLNPHVPTYYTVESMFNNTENDVNHVAQVLIDEFAKVKPKYENVPILLSDLEMDRVDHVEKYIEIFRSENLYSIETIRGIALNAKQISKNLDYLDKKGYFSNADKLYKYRATLCMIISFGISTGYKNIVLCGIDLNSPDYFYEDVKKYPHLEGFRSSIGSFPVHRTLTNHGIMQPIDNVVYALSDFGKKKGIKLSVANKKSALYPQLPLFDFHKE